MMKLPTTGEALSPDILLVSPGAYSLRALFFIGQEKDSWDLPIQPYQTPGRESDSEAGESPGRLLSSCAYSFPAGDDS